MVLSPPLQGLMPGSPSAPAAAKKDPKKRVPKKTESTFSVGAFIEDTRKIDYGHLQIDADLSHGQVILPCSLHRCR